jgi:hypothetical protein
MIFGFEDVATKQVNEGARRAIKGHCAKLGLILFLEG